MVEQDIRISKSKKAVREALLSLMGSEDPDKITITALSEKAGINRKTFYAHYQTLDDVFQDIEDELIDEVEEFLKMCMIEEYSLSPYSFLSFINTLYESNPEFYERVASNRNYNILVARVKNLIKKYIMQALNPPENYRELISFKADFYIGGTANAYVSWLRAGKPYPFSRLAELLVGELSKVLEDADRLLKIR